MQQVGSGKSKSAKRRANRALAKYDTQKLGSDVPSGQKLSPALADEIMKKHNITGVNYVLFKQLVAIDDWSTIANYALGLIE